jgi:hypothetical protein
LQADTIVPDPRKTQLFNRYTYAANNPLRFNDPDGHCGPLCWIGIGLGLTGVALTVNTSQPLPPEEQPSELQGWIDLGLMDTGLALQMPGVAGPLGYSACADGDCTNEAENATSVVRKFSSTDMKTLADFSQRVSQVQDQRGMRSFGEQWKMLGEIASQRPGTANNLFTLQRNGIVEGAMRVRETAGQFWIMQLEGLGGGLELSL